MRNREKSLTRGRGGCGDADDGERPLAAYNPFRPEPTRSGGGRQEKEKNIRRKI